MPEEMRLSRELPQRAGSAQWPAHDSSIVTGCSDNLIRVFPASGRGEMRTAVLMGHTSAKGVNGVTALVSSSGGTLVSGGRDGRILSWVDGTATEIAGSTGSHHGDASGKPDKCTGN